MNERELRHPPSSLFLAGPTATGKSEIALLLAEKLNGEIISVDSMQVYRGLDIGTAKPDAAERKRLPHHLIDVAELSEPFDAARFVRLAQAAVREIQSRGRMPIFCGGTGLYFKAFLEGLGEAPPADDALREKLAATPLPELLQELASRDPVTFDKIDRKNPRRVIRALEVIRLTGKPFSSQRASWSSPILHLQPSIIYCVQREPADLHARISERVDRMFKGGLVEEVKDLLSRGLAENRTAMQAIGYRQIVEHLRGEHSLPETIELVKIRTRQFAKRQMTWFRRQLPVKWIECGTKENSTCIAERMIVEFQGPSQIGR
ncbi:MAG TPA: tRNA (adenosine(37)-N6)-dimethylallyltransferase MiaA [Verrucomicrobiae bacterium]|nr:tRNA (adenosine(37)-N6)-dimethylallyltransferase MiaA [Verrucomicrobiae bacterium]